MFFLNNRLMSIHTDDDDDVCPICLCKEEPFEQLDCGHLIHPECLSYYREYGYTRCSICNHPIMPCESQSPCSMSDIELIYHPILALSLLLLLICLMSVMIVMFIDMIKNPHTDAGVAVLLCGIFSIILLILQRLFLIFHHLIRVRNLTH